MLNTLVHYTDAKEGLNLDEVSRSTSKRSRWRSPASRLTSVCCAEGEPMSAVKKTTSAEAPADRESGTHRAAPKLELSTRELIERALGADRIV
jgi:hypothetical protein